MNDKPQISRGGDAALPPDCRQVTQGVAFFDLSRMMEWASSQEDDRVAAMMQEFYCLAVARIEGAGGRVVKFIGDEGLAVFPREAAEKVVFALADLSAEVHRMATAHGFNTYLNTNVHFGPMIEGTFGPPGHERYDVLGKTVNIAARLGRRGLTLSQQAFRCLGAEAREKFDKIESPVNYRLRERGT
jgi:class 3 adenylate cyclase